MDTGVAIFPSGPVERALDCYGAAVAEFNGE